MMPSSQSNVMPGKSLNHTNPSQSAESRSRRRYASGVDIRSFETILDILVRRYSLACLAKHIGRKKHPPRVKGENRGRSFEVLRQTGDGVNCSPIESGSQSLWPVTGRAGRSVLQATAIPRGQYGTCRQSLALPFVLHHHVLRRW